MGEARCGKCGAGLPAGALVCSECGFEQVGDRPPHAMGDRWSLTRLERPWVSLPFISGTALAIIALASAVTGYLFRELASRLSEFSYDGAVLTRFAVVLAVLTVGLFYRARLAGKPEGGARKRGQAAAVLLALSAAALSLVGLGVQLDGDVFGEWPSLALTAAFVAAGVLAFVRSTRSWIPGAAVGGVAVVFAAIGLIDAFARLSVIPHPWLECSLVWAVLATGLWLGTTSRAATDGGP